MNMGARRVCESETAHTVGCQKRPAEGEKVFAPTAPHPVLGSWCFRVTGRRPGDLYDGSAILCPVLGTDHAYLLLLHSLLVQMMPRAAIYRHQDLIESKRPHFLTYGQEEDCTPISCPLAMADPGGFIYTSTGWMIGWDFRSHECFQRKNTL